MLQSNEPNKNLPTYQSTSLLMEKQRIQPMSEKEREENDYLTYLKPTGYQVPGYDPIKLVDELTQCVRGQGGHLEQTLTYVDPRSAQSWLTIARQQDYQNSQNGVPMESIVESIRDALLETTDWDQKSLEVVVLGPGDAHKEIRLIQGIKEGIPQLKSLYICLLEISQALLDHAERNVINAFKNEENIFLLSVPGDFRRIPRYHELFFKPPRNKRKRLIVMLGYTFSNLDSEIEFIRYSLGGFREGDMFLADYGLSIFAPAHDKEQLLEKDPYLQGTQRWRKTVEEFIVGPFKRHREDCEYIEFTPVLDHTLCIVGGSYCVELKVTAVDRDGSETNFSVHRIKRYHARQLVQAVCAEGWSNRNGWIYGPLQDRALTLWQKR